MFFGLLRSDSKRLGDIVDLQPVGTGMERNTKAQKDKKANKFSDIEVKKFNFFFFLFAAVVIVGSFLTLKLLSLSSSYSLLWLLVAGVNFILFTWHFYWIMSFDANYLRGAQRWRFHFFLSDALVSCAVGIQLAVLVHLNNDLEALWLIVLTALTGATLLMIDKFSPYRRALLAKISFFWVPLIVFGAYSVITNGLAFVDNSLKTLACTGLFFILMGHAKAAADRYLPLHQHPSH